MKPKENHIGKRIDLVITAEYPLVSRSTAKKLLEAHIVKVNGESVFANYKVRSGDEIELKESDIKKFMQNKNMQQLKPKEIEIDLLYEDEHTLVVHKPSGVLSHPVKKDEGDSVLNGLYFYLKQKEDEISKLRLVHRLDRDTSGVLLVAKNKQAHEFYSQQFEERIAKKVYRLVVKGKFEYLETVVNEPISTEKNSDGQYYISNNQDNSRFAKTTFKFIQTMIKDGEAFTQIYALPETGRTHQIRVHAKHLGFPIIGDKIYGGMQNKRLMLHAEQLRFLLFKSKQPKTITTKPKEDFRL